MSNRTAATSGPGIYSSRPLLAISSCLLGQQVRYDGRHRFDELIATVLDGRVDWLPVCPEVEIGLGVPRPPIHLTGDTDRPRVVAVHDAGLDVTERLLCFARQQSARLGGASGYIFKSRSPSCALADAILVDATGRAEEVTAGLYARVVRECLPALPMIDERAFRIGPDREAFLQAVWLFHENSRGDLR